MLYSYVTFEAMPQEQLTRVLRDFSVKETNGSGQERWTDFRILDHVFPTQEDATAFIERRTAQPGQAIAVQYKVPVETRRLSAASTKLTDMLDLLKRLPPSQSKRRAGLENKIAQQRKRVLDIKRTLARHTERTAWLVGGLLR